VNECLAEPDADKAQFVDVPQDFIPARPIHSYISRPARCVRPWGDFLDLGRVSQAPIARGHCKRPYAVPEGLQLGHEVAVHACPSIAAIALAPHFPDREIRR